MKSLIKPIGLAVVAPIIWSVDFDSGPTPFPVLANSAMAVIGRPATPGSYAGVARRTTRRAVYATSASASAASQQQQAQQQQAQPQQAPPPATGALPAGTVVSALPSGCTSTVVDGVNLFNCGGVFYQPTFQSNNLVYVVK
jgi:hypothetical protein